MRASTTGPTGAGDVERVLRECTDVFERGRAILAIAPEPDVDALLARLRHARCHRAAALSSPALQREDAESFDVAIAGAGAVECRPAHELRELARMLRPGGRLVMRVSASTAAGAAERLAGVGFFVTGAQGRGSTVLLAVRGEFAAYAS